MEAYLRFECPKSLTFPYDKQLIYILASYESLYANCPSLTALDLLQKQRLTPTKTAALTDRNVRDSRSISQRHCHQSEMSFAGSIDSYQTPLTTFYSVLKTK